VNLAKDRNGEVFEGGCANVCIQRGVTKRTIMGRSAIAGWGLFAGEKVKAGSFLGVLPFLCMVNRRNIKVRLSGMKKVKEEDFYMIKKEFLFYLL
jgi:hypothetical protein